MILTDDEKRMRDGAVATATDLLIRYEESTPAPAGSPSQGTE